MLDEQIYKKHYETIYHMARNLGIDSADDYLRQELSNASKEVAVLREKIIRINDSLPKTTNMDEFRHLQYDLEDALLLNNLLKKLKTADELYLCFKEYLRRNPKNIY